ncbi:hypothetical protein EDEG_00020 [Edhazardia aedis USNM 41457]|uniref:Uncharacterized protein n=1 Tax=Edhazardia aedis (strain USNM 41457) TaxID=1003232 RepID=J9DK05_EDHAE|nr:hypothetical protein EDEG_00020 [Edhazardia aedis USNM 41457]|eukprot:EJW01687.1 hypothetical protein EDEG_00020 [Edhazardia aedis USNM 41457]
MVWTQYVLMQMYFGVFEFTSKNDSNPIQNNTCTMEKARIIQKIETFISKEENKSYKKLYKIMKESKNSYFGIEIYYRFIEGKIEPQLEVYGVECNDDISMQSFKKQIKTMREFPFLSELHEFQDSYFLKNLFTIEHVQTKNNEESRAEREDYKVLLNTIQTKMGKDLIEISVEESYENKQQKLINDGQKNKKNRVKCLKANSQNTLYVLDLLMKKLILSDNETNSASKGYFFCFFNNKRIDAYTACYEHNEAGNFEEYEENDESFEPKIVYEVVENMNKEHSIEIYDVIFYFFFQISKYYKKVNVERKY